MNRRIEKIAHNRYTRDNLCIGVSLDFGQNQQNVYFEQKKKKKKQKPFLIDKDIMVKSLNETSQKQFTALRLREEYPPCSILIFSMGSVIIVGLRKLGLTPLSVLQAVSAIADTQEHPITISNVEIVNVVSTFNLFKLNFPSLKEFFREHKIAFTHVPDSFPGLFFKVLVPIRHLKRGETIGGYYTRAARERESGDTEAMKKNFRGKTVLVFQVGKCTILGACGGDDIHVIFKMLFGFFWYFIDNLVHLSDEEFENGKKKYHIPPLSWYLMTDFFLRTVPDYQLKSNVIFADLFPSLASKKTLVDKCTSLYSSPSSLDVATDFLTVIRQRMLRQTWREDYREWFLKLLVVPRRSSSPLPPPPPLLLLKQQPSPPLSTKIFLRKHHQSVFEKDLDKLCREEEEEEEEERRERIGYKNLSLTMQQSYGKLKRLQNLTRVLCKLEERLAKRNNTLATSYWTRCLFEGFEEYIPPSPMPPPPPSSSLLLTTPMPSSRSHLTNDAFNKIRKLRSNHKMKIRQLNQLEEIYDLVNRTTSEGRSDEIADFLGIDSYIISGLLNKDSPIPIKRSSVFSKDYTHMTPAQIFFNKHLYNNNKKYGNKTSEILNENRRGILDFIIGEEEEDVEHDQCSENLVRGNSSIATAVTIDDNNDDDNENNNSTKTYLDIQAIEKFLEDQGQHGIIFAPLSNYRTQHHQSLQTRLILENLKRQNQSSFSSLEHEMLTENYSFNKKGESKCCECKFTTNKLKRQTRCQPYSKNIVVKRRRKNFINSKKGGEKIPSIN